jgi:hypothetical protein
MVLVEMLKECAATRPCGKPLNSDLVIYVGR